MVYSGGLTIENSSYSVGFLLMSDGRLLRGRLSLAHLAAFFLTCLAKQTLENEGDIQYVSPGS